MPETPEWRRALRDLAAIALGVFIVIHETLREEPREILLYVAAFFIVGPAALRLLGK
jgi:hypothetical protein